MKTTVKHESDTRVKVTITAGRAELEAAEQVALKRLAKKVKVNGLNSHSNRNTHIRLKELCWTFVSMPFSRSSIKQVGC